MDQAKVNQHFATGFADQLARSGVMEVCLAPGSRSAPLAMAFARHHGLRTRVLIDERSCSFFAVGLAKAGGRPVAILCTSGTAAVEFHAAVVEAFHSSTPLIVLSRGQLGYGEPLDIPTDQLDAERKAQQADLARLSTNSRHIIAEKYRLAPLKGRVGHQFAHAGCFRKT